MGRWQGGATAVTPLCRAVSPPEWLIMTAAACYALLRLGSALRCRDGPDYGPEMVLSSAGRQSVRGCARAAPGGCRGSPGRGGVERPRWGDKGAQTARGRTPCSPWVAGARFVARTAVWRRLGLARTLPQLHSTRCTTRRGQGSCQGHATPCTLTLPSGRPRGVFHRHRRPGCRQCMLR